MTEPEQPTSGPEVAEPGDHAHRRMRFLSDVSQLLAASPELDVTIKTISELVVPYLADWCIITRATPSDTNDRQLTWEIITATHVDPGKSPLAQSVAELALGIRGNPAGVLPHVEALVALGQSVVLRLSSDDELRAIAPDESLRQGILALGAATIVVNPLRVRGQTIGALVLGSSDPARSYDAIDLALAADVAQRATLAIENATLCQQARDAVQQRDAFLSIVSHDLKNSLTLVSGYVQSLQREAESVALPRDRLETQLALIRTAVSTMSGQLEDLVAVPTLASGRQIPLKREPVDLVPLLERIVAEYTSTAPHHHLSFSAQPDSIVGQWDRARLERAFNNLLANAIKYSPSGGGVRVTISTEDHDKTPAAVVTIADDGIGIPRDELHHVFELFHRASNVRSRIPGTGLGLPSARSIVEQHGGRVDVSSNEGAGSTFIVRLPVQ
jgi:signal transduction histidine kinase